MNIGLLAAGGMIYFLMYQRREMFGLDAWHLALVLIILLLMFVSIRLQKFTKISSASTGELQKGFDNLKPEQSKPKNKT